MRFGQETQQGRYVTECKRCICDDTLPDITFNDGVCSYCDIHDSMEQMYPISKTDLESVVNDIKLAGRNKPFDAVVGISGGKDSSYLLHLASELGLNVIAVHYDNGWDKPVSKDNIKIMTDALEIPLINYRVNQNEVDDLIKSFLFSHTQDVEAATDLGLVKCMFDVACQYGIKYILDGHSFRTEGIAPIGWSYMDGRYIKSVHKKMGTVPLRTYPMLTLIDQLWYGLKGIKRPRLLYYVEYIPEKVIELLETKYGWKQYGGHHLENYFTAFFGCCYRLKKLGYDGRKIELSALIRSGNITRQEAIEQRLSKYDEEQIVRTVMDRLNISPVTFLSLMDKNIKKTHKDWPNYSKYFRVLKPIFWSMMKAGKIPNSFYIKYCNN